MDRTILSYGARTVWATRFSGQVPFLGRDRADALC